MLGNSDGTFAPEDRFAVGSRPVAIAIGDLNQDDHLDLALAFAYSPPHVSLLLGDGSGAFAEPITVELAARSLDVAIRDIDGDGRSDLVVGHTNGSFISVLLGLDGGAFDAPIEFAVWDIAGSGAGGALDVAEFNGDGRLDVVAASARTSTVSVLLHQLPTSIAFEFDKITLAWPILVDTISYNVYRGDLADLVDGDQDGLPDDGYGVCRNDSDPDLTDNVFVDAEDPVPGEGFFYLMEQVRAEGGMGIGTTSSGLSRVPEAFCPPAGFRNAGQPPH
jgi:hypothetical protein